ncbi:MAG: hypothetical protein IJS08_19660 [Victivallales bacterium]|nr:hypothetical protein [Victivallales bacterium]
MNQSDAEKYSSSQMNGKFEEYAETHGDGVRVVFIGNSITVHPVAPHLGWTNLWGMAASAKEKDYVHLVIDGIEKATGKLADCRIKNLADFERNFSSFDYGSIQELIDFNPDYLIVALGENVASLETREEQLAFREAFKKLLGCFVHGRTKPNTVVRGVFWSNDWKDEMMAHAASDYALPFVKADLSGDKSMQALGLFEHTGVQKHPGDKGMEEIARRILEGLFPTESGYTALVDGKAVPVRPIRISAIPFNQWAPGYQRPVDQTEIAGMLKFETEGKCEIRVRADRKFRNVKLRPLSSGVTPNIVEGEICFTLPGPGYYVLELDGYNRPLEIFADKKRDFSAERQAANIVFGPGLHEPVIVKLKSHDRVFIDKDAVVMGSFQVDNAEDIKVSGYGIICGSRNRRDGDDCYREGMDGAVRIIDSSNVLFDGPTVLDSCCWCVSAFNSSDLVFANMKVTGAWRYNTDGIDICNSQRVHIHNCFIHSFDDNIVIKGDFHKEPSMAPVEDIHAEHCVCWCGWGRTLEIGLETWAPYLKGIVYEDCDLIHNTHAALSVHLGGPGPVEDITFRNIRIEYDASEMKYIMQREGRDQIFTRIVPWSGSWLNVSNDKMFVPNGILYENIMDNPELLYCPLGTFKHLTLEDITITVDEGAIEPKCIMYALPGSTLGKIDIRNVKLNGKDISAQCVPLH